MRPSQQPEDARRALTDKDPRPVRKPDRRVRRTRDLLRRSLLELTREKGYQRVTVQDVLDRADVGRSTFYAHFRSKDELMLSGWDEISAALATGHDRPGGPMLDFFRHLADHRWLYPAIAGSKGSPVLERRMRGQLADLLRRLLQLEEDEAAVQFLVGGLTALVHWWMEGGQKESPEEMNATFARLISRSGSRS